MTVFFVLPYLNRAVFRDRHTVVTTRDNKQKITNQFHWVIENKIKTITWT